MHFLLNQEYTQPFGNIATLRYVNQIKFIWNTHHSHKDPPANIHLRKVNNRNIR